MCAVHGSLFIQKLFKSMNEDEKNWKGITKNTNKTPNAISEYRRRPRDKRH